MPPNRNNTERIQIQTVALSHLLFDLFHGIRSRKPLFREPEGDS